MSQTILTNLCNVLAHLYSDQPSIRRITHESGIDLSHIILESTAKNNWHSVLTEANKLDQLDALLDVVEREYGSNKEFRDTYAAYYRGLDEARTSGIKSHMLGNTQNFQYSGGKSPVLQHVQNGDQKLGNIFRSHSQLFRRYAVDVLSKSLEYSSFTNQLDSIFLLADRVLVAFSAHIEFNRVTKVAETLAVIETGYNETGRDIDCEILLQSTEQWLKALLWLVDRSKWNALYQNKKRFTLFPCIRELGLLTQQELDTPEDEYRTIADDVRRLIYWNSKDRNYVTHETSEAPEYIRSRYLPSALLTLIAPLCKHQGTIRENLKGLIPSPLLEDPDIVGLIRLIDGERCNHLARFRARNEWIARLKNKLLDNGAQSKSYILLFGHEGMGKSALSAKLSDELALHNMDILGPAANEIRKIAPWLPGVILHFGKQSNQPDEIVRSLLSQINTLLLTPYELSPSLSQIMTDHDSEDIISHQMILPNQFINRATRSEIIYPEIRNPTSYLIVQRSASYLSARDSTFQHTSIAPDLTYLRRVLHLALEQVGREYGPVVLIIDAVDEISADGTKLDFLPEYLPHNISVLLTARRGSRAFLWLTSNRQCESIQLEYLTRSEIPELTGLQDSDGEKEAEFNTRLYKESQGWPVLVQAAVQTIPQHRTSLAEIKISRSADSVFDRQAREWEQAAQKANDQTLVYLLHLLCIFEPAVPVDLEFVQSYLNYLGISLRLAELRQILQPVHTQLEGIESGRLKLSLKAFAEYIRERYCSKLDLRQALEKVVEWLERVMDLTKESERRF